MKPGSEPRPELAQLFWTVQETATALRLHPMTIRSMINRSEIFAIRFGRAIRIPIKAIEEQISQGLLAQGQARGKGMHIKTRDRAKAKTGIGRIRDGRRP